MVFYHWSDYIDTTTGKFADNFRTPPDYDLVGLHKKITPQADKAKAATGGQKKSECGKLINLFHRNKPTDDADYFAWHSGAVSEVCYAEGTTKKIDLYLIRKHLGDRVAGAILRETLTAAHSLWLKRDLQLFSSEKFVFFDNGSVNYPMKLAPAILDGNGRPTDSSLTVDNFYEMKGSYESSFAWIEKRYGELYWGDLCTGGEQEGIDGNGVLQCKFPNAPNKFPNGPKKAGRPVDMKYLLLHGGKVVMTADSMHASLMASLPQQYVGCAKFYYTWDFTGFLMPGAQTLPDCSERCREVFSSPMFAIQYVNKQPLCSCVTVFNPREDKTEQKCSDEAGKSFLFAAVYRVFQVGDRSLLVEKGAGEELEELKEWYTEANKDMKEEDLKAARRFVSTANSGNFDTLIVAYDQWKWAKGVFHITQLGFPGDDFGFYEQVQVTNGVLPAGLHQAAKPVILNRVALCTAPKKITHYGAADIYRGWYDLYGCGYYGWIQVVLARVGVTQVSKLYPEKCTGSSGKYFEWNTTVPFTAEKCHSIDVILNSTRLVFGDTSPGQIAALAATGKELKTANETCPAGDGWKGAKSSKSQWECIKDVSGTSDERYASLGCWKYAMKVYIGYGYSIAGCLSACKAQGYPIAGLQYHYRCHCGDHTFAQHGTSDNCDTYCYQGGGMCGGSTAVSVFLAENATVSSHYYTGCRKETANSGHTGTKLSFGDYYSVEHCVSKCKSTHFPFAALANNFCVCGDQKYVGTLAAATGCKVPCVLGDGMCGGSLTNGVWPISVYAVTKYTYAGCWKETANSNGVGTKFTYGDHYSVESCASTCKSKELPFASIGNNFCICGDHNYVGTLEVATSCDLPCALGDGMCGGNGVWQFSLYVVESSDLLYKKQQLKKQCQSSGYSVSTKNYTKAVSSPAVTETEKVVCSRSAFIEVDRKIDIPGVCCLDDPDVSGIWGEPYQCGQTCQHLAPSLAGISVSTCDIYGGTWCPKPTDCATLDKCVSDYLEIAKNTSNLSYEKYLSDAPKINNTRDSFQCGKAREYFGYEPTFPIDMKICDEVREYRNAQDFKFTNDVFMNMPPVPPPAKKVGSAGPDNGNDGSGDTSRKITLIAKSPTLATASEPSGQCDMKAFTIYDSIKTVHEGISDQECPDDLLGVVQTTCAIAKNIVNVVILVVQTLVKIAWTIAEIVSDAVCSDIDPYSVEGSHEEILAVHESVEIMLDFLAGRHLESHKSLNSISAQLKSVVDQLTKLDQTATVGKKIDDLWKHFNLKPAHRNRQLRARREKIDASQSNNHRDNNEGDPSIHTNTDWESDDDDNGLSELLVK